LARGINLLRLKISVVYVCNNNRYAYSTPLGGQMAVENVADRAEAGLPAKSLTATSWPFGAL
jgi:pyruvate dehydrogenase E1 component alpha subunit